MDAHIDRLLRTASERSEMLTLGAGLPAQELFPRAALERAFSAALHAAGDPALQYGWPEGNPGLRATIAGGLRRRHCDVQDDDVIITSGAQQAVAIAVEALLSAGDAIEVDAATYPAALDLFRSRGVVPVLASDRPIGNGAPPRARYVMPGIDNPRGLDLNDVRRGELLSSSQPIIADEAYAYLHFRGPPRPLLADARGRVWHVGTFSKTLSPGLRIGYLVPPRADVAHALARKHATDLQAASLTQSVLEHFLAQDDTERRLERARAFYARRAERMLSALRRHLPGARFREPQGGFSVFVELDEEGDDTSLLATATGLGVSFDPGRLFRHDDLSSPVAFRLCFSSTSLAGIEEGVRRLSRALVRWRAEGKKTGAVHAPETQELPLPR